MDIFILLVTNLLPLYLIIGLGFFAGRYLGVDRQMLANLALYLFIPVVSFGFVVHMELKPAYALLPVLVYAIAALVSLLFLNAGRRIYGDSRAHVLSLCTSMGNTGYFGLPLVLLLAEEQWVGVYMFMLLGYVIFEGTLGYYIAARGRLTVRDSLIKLAKFPSIYALAAALLYQWSGLPVPALFDTYWAHFKGAYVVVGMMIIGAALARVKDFDFSWGFLLLAFTGKFILWPGLTCLLIVIDRLYLGLFSGDAHRMFFVLSIVPPAANIAAFAAQMDLRPEKAATTVLLGTFFALFYIPLMLVLLNFY